MNIRLSTIALFIFLFISGRVAYAGNHPVACPLVVDSKLITARSETEKYCWIGTNNGLYMIRKKGNKVFHLTTKNSLLPSDRITSIAVNANGEAYIGTSSGILRYDNFAFLLINTENSALKSNHITSLTCLNGNEIYAGTLDKGITVFSGLRSRTYTAEDGYIADNRVIMFEQTGKDTLVAVLENNRRVSICNRKFRVLD